MPPRASRSVPGLPRLGPPLLALLALASACSSSSPPSHDPPLANAAPTATIEVGLRDLAFSTQTIEVTRDQVVDFRLENTGALDHDFTIERIPADTHVVGTQTAEHAGHGPNYAVHAAPGPGQTVTLRLHPHEAGTYTYYCTVKGHREAGMTGTLVVS